MAKMCKCELCGGVSFRDGTYYENRVCDTCDLLLERSKSIKQNYCAYCSKVSLAPLGLVITCNECLLETENKP